MLFAITLEIPSKNISRVSSYFPPRQVTLHLCNVICPNRGFQANNISPMWQYLATKRGSRQRTLYWCNLTCRKTKASMQQYKLLNAIACVLRAKYAKLVVRQLRCNKVSLSPDVTCSDSVRPVGKSSWRMREVWSRHNLSGLHATVKITAPCWRDGPAGP